MLLAAISSVMKAVAPVPLASGVQTVSATRVDPFSASLSGTVRGGESSLVTQFLPPCGPTSPGHVDGFRHFQNEADVARAPPHSDDE